MSDCNKRKRDPAFDYDEKRLLVQLVAKYFDTLECKKTDAASMRKKRETWLKLEAEYNASSSSPRAWTTLKTLWDNLKRKAKVAIASHNENLKGTGGGKPIPTPHDPVIEAVIGLIRPHVEPFPNPFDNSSDDEISQRSKDGFKPVTPRSSDEDPLLDATAFEPVMTQEDVLREEPVRSLVHESSQPLDWSHYNPSMLRDHAREEHSIKMKILKLQEQQEKEKLLQEKEKLLQEKLKTDLLRHALRKETGAVWRFEERNNDTAEHKQ